MPSSIVVVGSDIYFSGDDYLLFSTTGKARYWKNGVETVLSGTNKSAFGYQLFIEGGDIYLAGMETEGANPVAKIWKNGVVTNLTDGSQSATAASVFVKSGNVYGCGFEVKSSTPGTGTLYKAKLWNNGNASDLSNGAFDAKAMAIIVK
jgi:hypothetical protein